MINTDLCAWFALRVSKQWYNVCGRLVVDYPGNAVSCAVLVLLQHQQ